MGDSYPNFLHKMNIIPAASLLFRINIKGLPFVESNGFFIECTRGNYFNIKKSDHSSSWLRGFIPNWAQKHGCPIFFCLVIFSPPDET